MATVPASERISKMIMGNQDDPRMPAILEPDDWELWLGETRAPLEEVKATLKTMDGVSWKMEPERKAEYPRGAKRSGPGEKDGFL